MAVKVVEGFEAEREEPVRSVLEVRLAEELADLPKARGQGQQSLVLAIAHGKHGWEVLTWKRQ